MHQRWFLVIEPTALILDEIALDHLEVEAGLGVMFSRIVTEPVLGFDIVR